MSVLDIKIYPAVLFFYLKESYICKFNLKTFVSHADWLPLLPKKKDRIPSIAKSLIFVPAGLGDWLVA